MSSLTLQKSNRSCRRSAGPVYAIHDVPSPFSTRGSFCSAFSITNSNCNSWDISKMNSWSAASSCFNFALVLLMSSLETRPQAPVTVWGRGIQRDGSCLVRMTRLTRFPTGCQTASVCCGPSHCLFLPVTQICVTLLWWLSMCEGRC